MKSIFLTLITIITVDFSKENPEIKGWNHGKWGTPTENIEGEMEKNFAVKLNKWNQDDNPNPFSPKEEEKKFKISPGDLQYEQQLMAEFKDNERRVDRLEKKLDEFMNATKNSRLDGLRFKMRDTTDGSLIAIVVVAALGLVGVVASIVYKTKRQEKLESRKLYNSNYRRWPRPGTARSEKGKKKNRDETEELRREWRRKKEETQTARDAFDV